MTSARVWWHLISDQDRAQVLELVQHSASAPLPQGLAKRVLLKGADLIPVAGAEPDADSPYVLSDDDVDWIYAHGSDAVVEAGVDTSRAEPAG